MSPLVLHARPYPAITLLTLNRPLQRNALNIELITALTQHLLDAQDDPSQRVIILNAQGPAFCAGLDLHEAARPEGAERSAHALAELYRVLAESPLVTIAAAHGPVLGGGAGLLAACDFAIAAPDLILRFPEVQRGLVPALVSCLLSRRLSDNELRRLFLLCEPVSADEAQSLGLVSRVVPNDQLIAAACELAGRVLTGAPGAIASTKRLLNDLSGRPIAQQLQHAMEFHRQSRQSPEAAEGMAAFREKRAPRWES